MGGYIGLEINSKTFPLYVLLKGITIARIDHEKYIHKQNFFVPERGILWPDCSIMKNARSSFIVCVFLTKKQIV